MHLPAASSLLGVVMMLVVFGGIGITYLAVYRKRLSPKAQAAQLAAAGYRPGEGLRSHGVGKVLFIDDRGVGTAAASMFECGDPTLVQTSVTTQDRLLVDVSGKKMWFDATARPVIRRIGRIMVQDTTGIFDLLANQTETTTWFIRDGKQPPAGAAPKKLHNSHGVMEDVYVLELIAPCRPAIRFEAVESVVISLCQWAQAPLRATMPIPVQPMLAAPQYVAPAAQVPQMYAAPAAYGRPAPPPPHYAAPVAYGRPASQPPHYAAPAAYVAPTHPSSRPSRSSAPAPCAIIRRSQPRSQAAQPASYVPPYVPPYTPPQAPQAAYAHPQQPQPYAPRTTQLVRRTVPPPLPLDYVARFTATQVSPQHAGQGYHPAT